MRITSIYSATSFLWYVDDISSDTEELRWHSGPNEFPLTWGVFSSGHCLHWWGNRKASAASINSCINSIMAWKNMVYKKKKKASGCCKSTSCPCLCLVSFFRDPKLHNLENSQENSDYVLHATTIQEHGKLYLIFAWKVLVLASWQDRICLNQSFQKHMTLEEPQQNPSFQRVGDLQKKKKRTHVAWDNIHNMVVSTQLHKIQN